MITIKRIPPIVGIVVGITFYELGNTFQYLIQPVFFPTFLRLVGLLITVFFLCRASYKHLDGSISILFSFLMVWTFIMFLRGSLIGNYLPGSDSSIKGIIQRSLLSQYGAFSFFIPLIALIRIKPNSFYDLKRLAVFLCIVSLLMTFLMREEITNGILSKGLTSMMETDDVELSVRHLISALYPGFGLILLFLFFFNYIQGKVSFLFPIAIIVFFLSNAIGGGRGQTGLNLVYLFFFFFLIIKEPVTIRNGHTRSVSKKGRGLSYILLGGVFVLFIVYLYTNTSVFDYVLERSFGDKTLGGDFINNSRNILRDDMISDFNSHPLDWIWGRGVNGSYRTNHLSTGGFRAWMEWGYLYLVIKGGIVYLFLVVYCMLHAAYLGLFKSKNALSKGLAIMCIVFLLNLITTDSEPQFTTQYLLSWICFGLLERKQVRMMSDEMIFGYFNYKCLDPQ